VIETRYPGTCRGRYASVEDAQARSGKEVGIRLVVQPGSVAVHDQLAPPEAFDVAENVGDFLNGRRDGTPAYQLAVVLDDAHDGVTEVVRGADLLPSTARQILLQRAFGLAAPQYFHVPLVVDEHGRRLAKRQADTSLASLRERGADPRSIVRWVALGAGMDRAERSGARECVSDFDIHEVPRNEVVLAAHTLADLSR
jgi:glutamyl-tRNA synthetase